MSGHDGGGWSTVLTLLMYVALYVYNGLAFYRLAVRGGSDSPWMAWVPILSLWMLVEIAGAPWWWFLLFFLPGVNLVAAAVIGIGVAQALEKPAWWGALMAVPGVNLVAVGLLAWG